MIEAAAGRTFSADRRAECLLLNARLRDSLRAPALSTPELSDAAHRARQRGATVVLLDDGALVDEPEPVVTRIREAVMHVLDSGTAAAVTVRVLPPRQECTRDRNRR